MIWILLRSWRGSGLWKLPVCSTVTGARPYLVLVSDNRWGRESGVIPCLVPIDDMCFEWTSHACVQTEATLFLPSSRPNHVAHLISRRRRSIFLVLGPHNVCDSHLGPSLSLSLSLRNSSLAQTL